MTKNIRNPDQVIENSHLKRDRTGDVTFLVDSQRIRAHRAVLAALSPKYKAQFYGPNPDLGEIRVPNVPAAAFNVFLQFFCGKTTGLTMENIETVLDLATQSLVDEFIEICVNFLMETIKDNRLSIVYRLAVLYCSEPLCLECEKHISTKTTEVFGSDDFLQWNRDMLLFILKMDTLNCTEKYLFYACISWAQEQCKRNGLDDGKQENLRAVLGDVIYQIRFACFDAAEFGDFHRSFEEFFTADESFELFYMVTKTKNYKPKMFNPILRSMEAKAVRTVAWSKECDRFDKLKKLNEKIDVVGRSNFSFSSTKPIRMHGFVLGMHFKNTDPRNFPMNISLDGGRSDVVFKSKFKVYQNPARKNETMIVFEKPIEKVTKFTCSIVLPFKQLNYEFDLKMLGRSLENGEWETRFIFGGDKWVTRILYDEQVHDLASNEKLKMARAILQRPVGYFM